MRLPLLLVLLILGTGTALADPEEDLAALYGPGMPYAAFERLPRQPLEVDGGVLEVAFAPGEFTLPRSALLDWINTAAVALSGYYGRFPVAHARVLVIPQPGAGVRFGQAFGDQGPAVKVFVGEDSESHHLDRDWVMTHELAHLAFPSLHPRHRWLEEGLAVYVESVARLTTGVLSPEQVWGGFARSMPNGLPGPGDQGLDHTPTWGRTYWGGALFCLLADLEIRKRTENRRGLPDALRGVLAAGGHKGVRWPVERALEAADRATGATVLIDLYQRMKATPESVDLEQLWRDLGVEADGTSVRFDNTAPLAALRRAIGARPGN